MIRRSCLPQVLKSATIGALKCNFPPIITILIIIVIIISTTKSLLEVKLPYALSLRPSVGWMVGGSVCWLVGHNFRKVRKKFTSMLLS